VPEKGRSGFFGCAILLSNFLSKLLERLVARQLLAHLNSNGLLPRFQPAYRAHHSTETSVLKVLTDILLAVHAGDLSALVLLDLSAAFDTVDHGILLHRLDSSYQIVGSVQQWFQSYLSNRLQHVRVRSSSSSCGVMCTPGLRPTFPSVLRRSAANY